MKEQVTGNLVKPFFEGVIQSIIADMKSRKLMLSYTAKGLDTSMYETELYKVVFLLAGIRPEKQSEELKEWYFDQIEHIEDVEITDSERISEMAGEVLIGLMEKRKHLKP